MRHRQYPITWFLEKIHLQVAVDRRAYLADIITIITDVPFFQYKYVLLHKVDEPKSWEGGLNRIADLRLLSDLKKQSGSEDFKNLELMDKWN